MKKKKKKETKSKVQPRNLKLYSNIFKENNSAQKKENEIITDTEFEFANLIANKGNLNNELVISNNEQLCILPDDKVKSDNTTIENDEIKSVLFYKFIQLFKNGQIKITNDENFTTLDISLKGRDNKEIEFQIKYNDIEDNFEYIPIKIVSDIKNEEDKILLQQLDIHKDDIDKLLQKINGL